MHQLLAVQESNASPPLAGGRERGGKKDHPGQGVVSREGEPEGPEDGKFCGLVNSPDWRFTCSLLCGQEERERAIAAVKREWEEAHRSIDVTESSLPAGRKKPHKTKYLCRKIAPHA